MTFNEIIQDQEPSKGFLNTQEIIQARPSFINRASTALRSPLMVLSVVAAMFAASADKAYSAPINIHEDVSARQVIPGAGAVDYALTRYVFENNTDVEPAGSPLNENMDLGEVIGFYSTGSPSFEGMTPGWGGSSIQVGIDFWSSTVAPTASQYEVIPGQIGMFEIVSQIPKGTTPVYGNIIAQGYLEASPTDAQTVTGPIPEPATISLLSLGGLALLRRNLRSKSS